MASQWYKEKVLGEECEKPKFQQWSWPVDFTMEELSEINGANFSNCDERIYHDPVEHQDCGSDGSEHQLVKSEIGLNETEETTTNMTEDALFVTKLLGLPTETGNTQGHPTLQRCRFDVQVPVSRPGAESET